MHGKVAQNDREDIYELRLFDMPLMTFRLKLCGIEGLAAEPVRIDESVEKLLPFDLWPDGKNIVNWLWQRVIPKNRVFADRILGALCLSLGDVKGIIDAGKGLSLNDSYWIVPQGFKGSFKEHNLYENPFCEPLAQAAFTGSVNECKRFSQSPELTTGGMLQKMWQRTCGGGIFLYKGGLCGAGNTGYEPYSEHYACQVAKAMELDVIDYDLEEKDGVPASKCELFTDIDISFVAAARVVKKGRLKECIDYYKGLGDDFLQSLISMLVFDALIYNSDRHFGNFGFLVDSKKNEMVRPAPLFDHGLSLFNHAKDEDIDDLRRYASLCAPSYANITYEDICSQLIGKTQIRQLKGLVGFSFERHPRFNLPEDRILAIENHLQERIGYLLKLGKS